jgi:hypothetical protein
MTKYIDEQRRQLPAFQAKGQWVFNFQKPIQNTLILNFQFGSWVQEAKHDDIDGRNR